MTELDYDVYEELLEPLLKDTPIQNDDVDDDNSNLNAPIQKKS
jgi:hypothetical protein